MSRMAGRNVWRGKGAKPFRCIPLLVVIKQILSDGLMVAILDD